MYLLQWSADGTGFCVMAIPSASPAVSFVTARQTARTTWMRSRSVVSTGNIQRLKTAPHQLHVLDLSLQLELTGRSKQCQQSGFGSAQQLSRVHLGSHSTSNRRDGGDLSKTNRRILLPGTTNSSTNSCRRSFT